MKKIKIIFLGVLAALLAVEAILQIGSFFTARIFNKDQNVLDYDENVYSVVCLGDSWTYGLGATAQTNYPTYLQQMLDQKKEYGKFKVYNLGFPNFTSTMAIEKFQKVKDTLKPDIVIAMIGRSDGWNLDIGTDEKGFFSRVREMFLGLKIVKLTNIAVYNIKYALSKKQDGLNPQKNEDDQMFWSWVGKANEARESGDLNTACEYYDLAIELAPDFYLSYLEKARAYAMAGSQERALEFLEKALLLDSENNNIVKDAKDIFIKINDWISGNMTKGSKINDPGKTVGFFRKLYSLKPYSRELRNLLVDAYIVFADRYFIEKEFNKTVEIYDEALRLFPDEQKLYESFAYNQAILNVQGVSLAEHIEAQKKRKVQNPCSVPPYFIERRLSENLAKLIKTCRNSGIGIVLSGYPREIFPAVSDAAEKYKVALVDHRNSFRESKENLFVKDGHCNSAGYRVIAENLLDPVLLLVKEKYDTDGQ